LLEHGDPANLHDTPANMLLIIENLAQISILLMSLRKLRSRIKRLVLMCSERNGQNKTCSMGHGAQMSLRLADNMHLNHKKESRQTMELVSGVFLEDFPHPAMLIRRDKTVVASNRMAREMCAAAVGICGGDFPSNFDNQVGQCSYETGGENSLWNCDTKCLVCIAEQALASKETRNCAEARLLSRVWDVWWMPIADDLYLHYWTDATDRKRAEELLVQNERSKALGEMALGMAHNFNNTLQVIVSGARLGLLEAGSGNLSEVQKCLQKILSISLVGAGTLKSLIDFGRQHQELPDVPAKVFDLSKTIAGTVSLCDSFWTRIEEDKTINISTELNLTDHCLIEGNETEMFEVVMNMIKNSAEALPKGGKIVIATFVQDGRVIMEVSDTGVGIPEHQLAKVFEPFWTTKGLQGTGVGLAACHGIVRRHGGKISVISELGKGTTFRVALPFRGEAGLENDDGAIDVVDLKLRVLLIDDVPELVSLLQDALALYGHEVFTALSGQEGLEIIFGEREPFDVVMCDITMEGMNGWEVAKGVKGYCEEVGLPKPVFFLLTGSGSQATAGRNIEEWGVDSIVQKPVDLLVLMGHVRQVIQKTQPQELEVESLVG
jgi:signal transduction histidine kinase/ActR/RegA family two-component response regulator